MDVDKTTLNPISHYIMLEKNFPVTKRKWAFSLGIGYLWQGQDKYRGVLARERLKGKSQILLRPNLKF